MKISQRGYVWITLIGFCLVVWALIVLSTVGVISLMNGN